MAKYSKKLNSKKRYISRKRKSNNKRKTNRKRSKRRYTRRNKSGGAGAQKDSLKEFNILKNSKSQWEILKNWNKRLEKRLESLSIISKEDESNVHLKEPKSITSELKCEKNPCERLTGGKFGEVFKGQYDEKEVAIKTLKKIDDKEQFMLEATILAQFDDDNVVKLYGTSTKPNETNVLCLVMEWCEHGDIKSYLEKNNNKTNLDQKLKWLKQICSGMEHIHSKHVIHRDLAARNILLNNELQAKVADFGLSHLFKNPKQNGGNPVYQTVESRQTNQTTYAPIEPSENIDSPTFYGALDRPIINKQQNYGALGSSNINGQQNYVIGGPAMLPVRWCAPEILKSYRFTKKSDVWAFGITLYEIISNKVPYQFLDNKQVVEMIIGRNDYYPCKKGEIPDKIFEVMENCLKQEPNERMSFDKLKTQLSKLDIQSEILVDTSTPNANNNFKGKFHSYTSTPIYEKVDNLTKIESGELRNRTSNNQDKIYEQLVKRTEIKSKTLSNLTVEAQEAPENDENNSKEEPKPNQVSKN